MAQYILLSKKCGLKSLSESVFFQRKILRYIIIITKHLNKINCFVGFVLFLATVLDDWLGSSPPLMNLKYINVLESWVLYVFSSCTRFFYKQPSC